MTTYAISDLHGQLPDIPNDAELILIGGDICPDYGHSFSDFQYGVSLQADWLDTIFRAWLNTTDAKVVAVWGNHDFVGEKADLVPELPWTLIQDTMVVRNGLSIYGTPWVPNLPSWAFYGSDRMLEARAQIIPFGLDVLISHGPPLGYGDAIPPYTKFNPDDDVLHVGDPTIADAIKRELPQVTICGHIHEGYGSYDIEGNLVLNVAAVDENYVLRPNPWTRLDV